MLYVEMVSVDLGKPRVSRLAEEGGEGFEVRSYHLTSVQTGLLRKKGDG